MRSAVSLKHFCRGNETNQSLQIETVRNEVVGEDFEAGRVRSFERDVIDGLDEWAVVKQSPNAIDGRASEGVVPGMRHPFGQTFAQGAIGGEQIGFEGDFWLNEFFFGL